MAYYKGIEREREIERETGMRCVERGWLLGRLVKERRGYRGKRRLWRCSRDSSLRVGEPNTAMLTSLTYYCVYYCSGWLISKMAD